MKALRRLTGYLPLPVDVDVGLKRPPDATVLSAAAAASEGMDAAMARNPESVHEE